MVQIEVVIVFNLLVSSRDKPGFFACFSEKLHPNGVSYHKLIVTPNGRKQYEMGTFNRLAWLIGKPRYIRLFEAFLEWRSGQWVV